MHDPRPLRGGQELVAEAQQAAGRDDVRQMGSAVHAAVLQVDHLAAALAEQVDRRADVGLRHLEVHLFVGLEALAVHPVLVDHLRARDLELVALAAHGLDQDRQLELAPARDQEGVGAVGFLDAQGDVVQQLVTTGARAACARCPTSPPGRRRARC